MKLDDIKYYKAQIKIRKDIIKDLQTAIKALSLRNYDSYKKEIEYEEYFEEYHDVVYKATSNLKQEIQNWEMEKYRLNELLKIKKVLLKAD